MASPAPSVVAALEAAGLDYRVIEHTTPVRSLAEAAAARGVDVVDVIKTLVVRRGEGDYLFVLVPGGRQISWPKLRALLAVSRMSMPPAPEAFEATGFERGTITPLGSTTAVARRGRPHASPSAARSRWAAGCTRSRSGSTRRRSSRRPAATVADVTDPE